jgi:hypothetical protein
MDTVPLVRKPTNPVSAEPRKKIWVIHKLVNWWNKIMDPSSSSSSLTKIEPVRQKKKQKRIVRTLARWWKKRRAYYVHVKHGSEGSNSSSGVAQMHDLTMDDIDSMSSDERSKLLRDHVEDRFHCNSSDNEPDTFDSSSFTTPQKSNGTCEIESAQIPNAMQLQSAAIPLQSNLGKKQVVTMESPPTTDSAANQTTVRIPFVRERSDQCSIMSIDSLLDSEWDPEDDIFVDDDDSSQITPLATNAITSYDFLSEHMNFLHVQTQPRPVQVFFSYVPEMSELLGKTSQNSRTIGAEKRR